MKTIKSRVLLFAVLLFLDLTFCGVLFIFRFSWQEYGFFWQFLPFAAAGIFLAVLLGYAVKMLKIAGLILENQLLCIRPAILVGDEETMRGYGKERSMEVYVSYFGILLGSDIIKFNQDGIQLKSVEIGPDFLVLAYGNGTKTERIRLLRAGLNREELGEITEKFRYETGIVPVIKE